MWRMHILEHLTSQRRLFQARDVENSPESVQEVSDVGRVIVRRPFQGPDLVHHTIQSQGIRLTIRATKSVVSQMTHPS